MSQKFNHLIIGIGGTGCSVIRNLRERLYSKWHKAGNLGTNLGIFDFEQSSSEGETFTCRVATLSIDSDPHGFDETGGGGLSRGVLCKQPYLLERDRILLTPTSLAEQLGNFGRPYGIGYPRSRRGTRMALGSGHRMATVVERVVQRIDEMEDGGGADIHIVCSLAGSTGSSMVMALIAELQKANCWRHLPMCRVFVHALANPYDDASLWGSMFHANQYAALIELNAICLGIYTPSDLTLDVGEHSAPAVRPFESARLPTSVALLTETNARGERFSITQRIQATAEFLFQLSAGQTCELPLQFRNSLTMAPFVQFPADEIGGTRSTRFLSYGVHKLAIPDQEIRDKLALTFASQFARRALFSNWEEGIGYLNRPLLPRFLGFIAARVSNWSLTKDHLNLNYREPVSGEEKMPVFLDEWSSAIRTIAEEVVSQGGVTRTSIEELESAVIVYQTSRFRTLGLETYFALQRDPTKMAERASLLRKKVEADLLREFESLSLELPLVDSPDCVSEVRKRLMDQIADFAKSRANASEHLTVLASQIEELRRRFDKGGIFAKLKRRKLYVQIVETVIKRQYWQTIEQASAYAMEFVPRLEAELTDLEHTLHELRSRMIELSQALDNEISLRLRRDADAVPGVDYLVDADEVNRVIREKFVADRRIQYEQTQATIAHLRDCVGFHSGGFKAYRDASRGPWGSIGDDVFSARLVEVAGVRSIDAHKQLTLTDRTFVPIIGVNVVKKLCEMCNGCLPTLDPMIRRVMDKTVPALQFDIAGMHMNLGPVGPEGPRLVRCVFVPQCAELAANGLDFQWQLGQMLVGLQPHVAGVVHEETMVQNVLESGNVCEIVILTAAHFFTGRQTMTVKDLALRFQQRTAGLSEIDKKQFLSEVFLENHEPPLPDLL